MVDNKKTCFLLGENFGKNETNVLFTQRLGLFSKTQKGSSDIECHPPLTQKSFKSPVPTIFVCIIAQLPRFSAAKYPPKNFWGRPKWPRWVTGTPGSCRPTWQRRELTHLQGALLPSKPKVLGHVSAKKVEQVRDGITKPTLLWGFSSFLRYFRGFLEDTWIILDSQKWYLSLIFQRTALSLDSFPMLEAKRHLPDRWTCRVSNQAALLTGWNG